MAQSHVIPKWAHRKVKSSGGPNENYITKIYSSEDKTINGLIEIKEQDDWEYILCRDCDSLLGVYEDYLKIFLTQYPSTTNWKGANNRWESLNIKFDKYLNEEGNIYILDNVDEAKLKKGLYGILYKAHFAKNNYSDVQISKRKLKLLQKLLLGGSNGDMKLRVSKAMKTFNFYNPTVNNLLKAFRIKRISTSEYEIDLGGWVFHLSLDFKSSGYDIFSQNYMIIHVFFFGQAMGNRSFCIFNDNIHPFSNFLDIQPWYPSNYSCPCGQSLTYQECCLKYIFNPFNYWVPEEFFTLHILPKRPKPYRGTTIFHMDMLPSRMFA